MEKEPINEEQQELSVEDRLAAALVRIEELETDRLYRQAEFENYRKNALKDKADLILNGGRKVLESLLPIMDDFDLALQHMPSDEATAAVKEGVELISKKLAQVMKSHGVGEMEVIGTEFDTDFHEAIAQIPSPTPEMKGKVVDCTKKGYTLNDKVLRVAQVVVAE